MGWGRGPRPTRPVNLSGPARANQSADRSMACHGSTHGHGSSAGSDVTGRGILCRNKKKQTNKQKKTKNKQTERPNSPTKRRFGKRQQQQQQQQQQHEQQQKRSRTKHETTFPTTGVASRSHSIRSILKISNKTKLKLDILGKPSKTLVGLDTTDHLLILNSNQNKRKPQNPVKLGNLRRTSQFNEFIVNSNQSQRKPQNPVKLGKTSNNEQGGGGGH